MSASRNIPGRASESYKDALLKKYRKVIEMGGNLTLLEYPAAGGANYSEVKVKLELDRNRTDWEGWQTVYVGTGRDDKDKKGALKNLLEELDVKVPSPADEKKLRELAHNVITKRYNSIVIAAIVNETISDGKAAVEVKLKNWSLVAQGTGDSLDDAYKSAKPTP